MIAIVDYGLGNVHSIKNMLKHIDVEACITDDKEIIEESSGIIIPGVGKFDEGITRLSVKGLDYLIKKEADNGKPILGICLGMQLLGKNSEEGTKEGLGLIDMVSMKFTFNNDENLKVPHMGWEPVKVKESPLTMGISGKQRYYFVHSYHAICEKKENVIITCDYGYEFAAGVRNNKVYGVQFHPEKSHRFGMKILENFARIK